MTLLTVFAALLLVLVGLTVRKRPAVAAGIVVVAGLAWAGLAMLPHYTVHTLPVWLPALPFAVVAVTLFSLGFLAWFTGRDR
jgi:hypothetical protein